jgi:hypothetical protein
VGEIGVDDVQGRKKGSSWVVGGDGSMFRAQGWVELPPFQISSCQSGVDSWGMVAAQDTIIESSS